MVNEICDIEKKIHREFYNEIENLSDRIAKRFVELTEQHDIPIWSVELRNEEGKPVMYKASNEMILLDHYVSDNLSQMVRTQFWRFRTKYQHNNKPE